MKTIYVDILGPGRVAVVDEKHGGFADVLILSGDSVTPSHALKLIRMREGSGDDLRSEVSPLAHLPPHRNVVEIEACTPTEMGTGILMPYYPTNLRAFMQGRKEMSDILSKAIQIAEGLRHLHEHGILHLDLKPENILLAVDATAALSDFGLSKVVERPTLRENPSLKVAMPTISGTLLYMAPEQLLATVVSVKTDVFAYGVLLYEGVTGHLPFTGETVQEYARSVLFAPIWFSLAERLRIPGWLRSLVTLALDKSPDRRPLPSEIIKTLHSQQCPLSQPLEDEDHVVRDINRAGALSAAGDSKTASSLLGEVIKKHPWNLTARINIAEVHFAMGNTEEAIRSGQIAYDLLPWCPDHGSSEQVLCLNLSLYLMTRDPTRAYFITKRALLRYPDNWELLHNHAEACRLISIGSTTPQPKMVQEGLACAERAVAQNPRDESLRITYAGLLRLAKDRKRFVPYLNQLMQDVGEHSVAARILFLNALLDEGSLDDVERQIKELSEIEEFTGLLEGIKERLQEQRRMGKT
jgi:serine/threonine protein kinase